MHVYYASTLEARCHKMASFDWRSRMSNPRLSSACKIEWMITNLCHIMYLKAYAQRHPTARVCGFYFIYRIRSVIYRITLSGSGFLMNIISPVFSCKTKNPMTAWIPKIPLFACSTLITACEPLLAWLPCSVSSLSLSLLKLFLSTRIACRLWEQVLVLGLCRASRAGILCLWPCGNGPLCWKPLEMGALALLVGTQSKCQPIEWDFGETQCTSSPGTLHLHHPFDRGAQAS